MTSAWDETTLPTILSQYELGDIYNADEFGLFYKALPSQSLQLKSEKCTGDKYSKESRAYQLQTQLVKNCRCL